MSIKDQVQKLKDETELAIANIEGKAVAGVDPKQLFLKVLGGELKDLAIKDIKKGKLDPTVPYDLKLNSDRLIKAWKANKVTSKALVRFHIEDADLVDMMKGVLNDLGFKEIKE